MKLLHTSDWHLGHTIYNFDRREEQWKMLEQIAGIVKEEQPDIFILSGDVYDNSQPSASVQKMFAEGLDAIHKANPQMHIIVTAGNHDSGARHEVCCIPWNVMNVKMIGLLDKEDISKHILEIPGKAFIAALPYTYEKSIPEGFFKRILEEIDRRNSDNLPVVMSAHLTVSGCNFAGHDNASEKIVGGISSYNIDEFGDTYDYLALGHIHKGQFIPSGKHNIRYSGSPLAVSFDENYSHSVSIVEIEKHGDKPEVRTVEITNPKPLVTLPANGYTDWESAKGLLQQFSDDIDAYIRLNVLIANPLPQDAKYQAEKIVSGKKCRFCCINAIRKEAVGNSVHTLSVQEFKKEDPMSIAKRYIEGKGYTFTSEMIEMFRTAVERIREDEDGESRNQETR